MCVAPPSAMSSSVSSNSAAIMGQGQHHVAADVLKACPAGRRKGRAGLRAVWGRPSVFSWVSRADCTQRRCGSPPPPGSPQGLLGHGLRVGLQRDLRPGCRSCRRNEPGGISRGEQAGGAAAKIDRVRVKRRFRRKAGKLPQKGIHILGWAHRAGRGQNRNHSTGIWKSSREYADKVQETYNITAFFTKRSFLCSIL